MTEAGKVREARARGEADAAKAQFMATVEEAKVRLAPGKLASDAVQSAKDKSIVVADDAVTAVKKKPGAAAGVAGGLLLLLARKPLFRGVVRLFRGKGRSNNQSDRRGDNAVDYER